MKIYYFSSTHWDREWYQSFQGFRKRLAETTEGICDHLERDPAFGVFHFDGQTVVLEDAVELRPDLAPRIGRLVRSRRLLVGPWYVMPDEFLVSGEALVRNLLTGRALARRWGAEPWSFGYVCDIFGHVAQLPQILAGFGIRCALVGRGTNESTTEHFFLWESPDGTSCPTVKLFDFMGYGDFNMQVFGFGNDEVGEVEFKEKAKAYIDGKKSSLKVPLLVLMDGIDHAPIHVRSSLYLRWLRELYPEDEFLPVDLSRIAEDLERLRDRLATKKGELLESAKSIAPYLHLISNTLSSYYPLKQRNDMLQAELERRIAPMLASSDLGSSILHRNIFGLAWKHLLQNQAHDSICGCSVARVHRDMIYRYDQAADLCGEIRGDFLLEDLAAISGGNPRTEAFYKGVRGDSIAVRLFNPLPFETTRVLDIDIDLPPDFPRTFAEPFGYQRKPAFRLFSEDGSQLPYRLERFRRSCKKRLFNQFATTVDIASCVVRLSLRPMGWTSLLAVPSDGPVRELGGLLSGPLEATNEFLVLSVLPDGSFSVKDRRSGVLRSGFNRFASDAEIGDGWYHASPLGSALAYSGAPTSVQVHENSPDRAVFRIETSLELPAELRWEGSLGEGFSGIVPSPERRVVRIATKLSLERGSDTVCMEIDVENTARDHRLRMLVPAPGAVEYLASQCYGFVKRPFGRQSGEETKDWKELEPVEKNFGSVLVLQDVPGGGFCLFSAFGIHEVGSYPDASVYVTLLRSFRRSVMTNGEEDGQLSGRHAFAFALSFPEDPGDLGAIQREYLAFSMKPETYSTAFFRKDRLGGKSFLSVSGRGISCPTIKPAEDGKPGAIIVRLVNLSDETSVARLEFLRTPTSLSLVDLAEENGVPGTVRHREKQAEVDIAPRAILTLRVAFGNGPAGDEQSRKHC
jgi:alpha-mannosidase